MKKTNFLIYALLATLFVVNTGCDDKGLPDHENEEEIIDLVRLTFTPTQGTPLVFEAKDPDGSGIQNFSIPTISLVKNTQYALFIEVRNEQANEDITAEIKLEDAEHLFLFGWTDGIFSNPAGDGNIDNRADAVNYSDEDGLGLPLGLLSTWTTGDVSPAGTTFRVVLKHQPAIKSATSSFNDGETDIDLTFDIEIL